MSELILYTSDDGQIRLHLRAEGQTIWLTQAEIAALFATTKANVSIHTKNIFEDGELVRDSVVKESLTPAADGKSYKTQFYSLDLILAIGFRIRSPRGAEFRRWANRNLQDYLIKGFAMDDERLKQADQWDYFDELLARIRDIRASEKRFYQKVRDLFALSSDYGTKEEETKTFFGIVQNKLLYAVTGHTAAELIVNRADETQPNMALKTWGGARVRAGDIYIAKNYLNEDEIDTLNRLVVIFLEQAELRTKKRQELTLEFWKSNVNSMLAFNDQPILSGPGTMSRDAMKSIVKQRYDTFDANRKEAEAAQADADDARHLKELEDLAKKAPKP